MSRQQLSTKETNHYHISRVVHKIFNRWETHTMQKALNGPEKRTDVQALNSTKKKGYGVMSKRQQPISEINNQEHTTRGRHKIFNK